MGVLLEGLKKAKDDEKIIKDTSSDKNFGMSLYNNYYEHFPMFFNRFGSEIDLVGQYRGASAFLICNGPSLSSGAYDLTQLKRPGIVTYGMNNGVRTIRPNFWSCVDSPERFLKSIWLDPVITKIVPLTFSEKLIFDGEKWKTASIKVQECPNIIYFRRNEKFVANRFLKELTINWGNHKDFGGGRSVMLAIIKILFLLGFRNVFLMGADFLMTEKYTYHFDEQRHSGAVKGNMNTYEKLKTVYFPELKPHFEKEGFHVYNCNKESELKVFDYVPFEDAIAFATSNLGDVDNERTWGMYSRPEERQKWVNEPPEKQKVHLNAIAARPQVPVFIDKNPSVVAEEIPVDIPAEDPVEAPAEETANNPVVNIPITPGVPTAVPMPNIPKESVSPLAVAASEKRNAEVVKHNKPPSIKFVDFKNQDLKPPLAQPLITQPNQPNQPNRIIRNMPCGAGSSFGSSATEIPGHINVTIEDNGR